MYVVCIYVCMYVHVCVLKNLLEVCMCVCVLKNLLELGLL